jgi:hypothetical protein
MSKNLVNLPQDTTVQDMVAAILMARGSQGGAATRISVMAGNSEGVMTGDGVLMVVFGDEERIQKCLDAFKEITGRESE